MSSTLFEPERKDGGQPKGNRRLADVVTVQYRINHLKYEVDVGELRLTPGDQVIVATSKGPTIADVTDQVRRKTIKTGDIPRALRKATEHDLRDAEDNIALEDQAYRFALRQIRERKLPMKLIRTQQLHDGSRLIFFFSADGRIDFRDLVRDLAGEFRTRIAMCQIGVRDSAQMIGGIGPCGRELCCSTFLDHFEPISIRIAKKQGITLSPTKISGMCGRLMCCLVYEQKVYRRMRSKLPRAGQKVLTETGQGIVRKIDIINRRVTVSVPDKAKRLVLPIEEVRPVSQKNTVDADDSGEDTRLWEDGPRRKSPSENN